jgi:hypothetical protein
MMMGGQHHAVVFSLQEKRSALVVQEAGWVPRPVCTGTENLLANDIWNKSISVLKYRIDKF